MSSEGTEPQTWIFQANPKKYRISDSLENETEELWNLNQHADLIKPGDRVLLWLSGADSGVYALGTVLGYPLLTPDTPEGLEYWILKTEGAKVKPRVRVRYDKVFKMQPILKPLLLTDPVLSDLRIIRCAMGTNFKVSKEEWEAFQVWLREIT